MKTQANKIIFIFFTAFLMMNTKIALSDVELTEFSLLEQKVWTSSDEELDLLEAQANKILQMDPKSVYAHYLLSHLALRAYSLQPSNVFYIGMAGNLAQQAIDLDPRSDLGYIAMAEVIDLVESSEKSLMLLQNAMNNISQPSWRCYFMLGKLNSDQGDSEKIIALYEQALFFKDSLKDIIAPYLIAVLKANFQAKELITHLKKWSETTPHSEFDLALAEAYQGQGRLDVAGQILQESIKQGRGSIDIRINLAMIYLDKRSGAEQASKILSVLTPSEMTHSIKVSKWIDILHAQIYLAKGKYAEANKIFLTVLKNTTSEQFRDDLDLVFESYQKMSNFKELRAFLTSVKDEIAGSGYFYSKLGKLESEKIGNHPRAVEAFNNAIVLEPTKSEHFNNLGLSFYRMNNIVEAGQAFTKAVQTDPEDASAHYNLACILSLQGRFSDALVSLEESFMLNPELAITAQSDKDLDSLKLRKEYKELVEVTKHKLVDNEYSH